MPSLRERLRLGVDEVSFGSFRGHLELTIYEGSPLLHVASVMDEVSHFEALGISFGKP